MSSVDGRLQEVVAYESIDHTLVQTILIAKTSPCFQCFIRVKSQFRKKFGSINWEISLSCTTQEYDNVSTTYYPIFALLYVSVKVVAYGMFQN